MSTPVPRDELIRYVESSLEILEGDYRGHAAESDLYEAALVSIAVAASVAAGGTPRITYDGYRPTTQLRFRRGPGHLWLRDYTFIAVRFPDTTVQLEIHLGVMVTGGSGVAHECDVAVLDRAEAEWSRSTQLHPRKNNLVAAIEAKNYSASPDLGIGRGFLGLGAELAKDRCSLVFPARGSTNVMKMIAKQKSGVCFDELRPYSPAATRLQSHLETAMRNWIAGRA